MGLSLRCHHRQVHSLPSHVSLTGYRLSLNPGPYGAGVFDPRSWAGGNEETSNTITLEFTRVVLAIGVFAIGVELPKAYVARHWKSLFFLLGPVMTWVCGAHLDFDLISQTIKPLGVVCIRRLNLRVHSRPRFPFQSCRWRMFNTHRPHPCRGCGWRKVRRQARARPHPSATVRGVRM